MHDHESKKTMYFNLTMNELTTSLILLFLLALCSGTLADESSLRLSLEDCIELGLERSVELANARRDLEDARMQIDVVRAQAHPQLDLNANYTRLDDIPSYPDLFGEIGKRNTYAASLDAEQLLYSGGSVRAALRVAGHMESASEWELEDTTSNLIRRIAHGFHNVLFHEEALEVARQSVRQLESLEEQARRRYEAETASEFDWLSAQVALANEKPVLIAAANALTLARREFRDLIHLDSDDFELDGDLAVALSEFGLAELQQHALESNATLQQLREREQMAVHQRRVTQGDYQPDVRAFASYGGSEPSQRDPFSDGWEWEWVAGVRVSWSLFDGGRRRAQLRSNELQIEKIGGQIYDMERAVRLHVERHWLNLKEASETLDSTTDNIELAERALEIASVRYQQGLSTNLDYTESNLALNRARLNHKRALLEYRYALEDLKYVMGVRALPDGEDQ